MVKSCAGAAGVYCGLGLYVPVIPTIVAVAAVGLVRILAWERKRSVVWNLAVCALAMLAAAVTVEGSGINTFRVFWMGAGYGATGIGIVAIARSQVSAALRAGLRTMAQGILGSDARK